jgi:hypothetical protein
VDIAVTHRSDRNDGEIEGVEQRQTFGDHEAEGAQGHDDQEGRQEDTQPEPDGFHKLLPPACFNPSTEKRTTSTTCRDSAYTKKPETKSGRRTGAKAVFRERKLCRTHQCLPDRVDEP